MRRRSTWLALVASALVLSAPSAWGCSCLGPPPPMEAFGAADAVFAGLVLEIEDPFALGAFDPRFGERVVSSDRPLLCRFLVDAWWKGGQSDALVVITDASGASCGYTFLRGRRYLVYAYDQPFPLRGLGNRRPGDPGLAWPDSLGPQPRYGTGLCSRTQPLEDARVDLCQFPAPMRMRPLTSAPVYDPNEVLTDVLARIRAEWPHVSHPTLQPLQDLRFGYEVTVPLLAELVTAGSQQAASILGEYGPAGRPALPALAQALCDTQYYLRAVAWGSIGRMCPEARELRPAPRRDGADLSDCGDLAGRVQAACPCSWTAAR